MKWFIGIMAAIFLTLFCLGIGVEKMNQRRKKDPLYDAKITKIINKTDPYYNFIYNLFGWILGALIIYYIYLG